MPAVDRLLVDHQQLLIGGRAIEVACGLGASSLFIAERGYEVDAVDISLSALSELASEAKKNGLPVRPIVADLDFFPLPERLYDLFLVFLFFSPSLMAQIENALRPGGLLFYSTYNYRHTSVRPGFDEKYLVPSGGLACYFPGLSVVLNEPDAGDAGNISRLIGRKP
jgi:tellurite methyltransferase